MAERIRITLDVSDRVRRALNIEAAKLVCSVGELIERLVTDSLHDSLKIADEAISKGEKQGTNKRGRPAKQ